MQLHMPLAQATRETGGMSKEQVSPGAAHSSAARMPGASQAALQNSLVEHP